MAIFSYTAKNPHGETVKGKVEAQDKSQAAGVLISRKLLVIDISLLSGSGLSVLSGALNKVKHEDLVNFTRQLSTMIDAGLPLATGLNILKEQDNPAMKEVVSSLLREVEGGSTFAKSLAKQSDVFDRTYIQLVKAGELGGVLDKVLDKLAENLEKDKEFKAKTKGAMIYPIIVFIAMLVVGFVMMIFVIPKLTDMYKDFGAELPLPTLILMSVANFMAKYWWLILSIIGGGVSGLRSWNKTKIGQRKIDGFLFKVPIIGTLRQKIILTSFARTLSLLLNSGVPLLNALMIVTESMDSILYREAMQSISKKVEKGVSLSGAVSVFSLFPGILHQMLAVGEETGKLDEVLLKLSKYFESESEQAVKNLTSAMEPLIMVVLGIGVGAMVIAIIMPIYSLTSQF
ncbi:MAG: type II secretion system F family protein [Candidatus Pacebacteria bacterium]|jgi:type IV pilus assembly protein PilC|nr:type II secretion system F family protein [Candidatus Paceibacterota bacterium]MBT4652682.1 type II secretion system F family protein [Candidatus Paceibacterota bacterium]MBT6755839.1 type II secretion system F family protein [Candidatus Paceibacterota bacterium]MBT6921052.1 type II secretion system F family protein [Candidatus Paceibacterota bacterium]